MPKEQVSSIVYIATNRAMPDLIKIGMSEKDIGERIKQLSRNASVPVPFECYYACKVKDARDIERRLHGAFGDHRINPRREFFRINPVRVKIILEALSLEDVTPETDVVKDSQDAETLRLAKQRQPIFRFSMVNIPPKATLRFINDENVTCTVADDRWVEFEGKMTSLSNSAKTALHRHGSQLIGVQGPRYWVYENETLMERRVRMEDEESEEDG